MKPLHVCCIFGTRPEVIKMAPVIHALLKKNDVVKTHVVCSGQHRELLYPLIDWFDLKVDVNLDVMQANQSLNTLAANLIGEFGELFKKESYDCVVAQGDTTTVLMAALAAFYAGIPFAHVEAGLRTFDRNFPFPEEMNRVLAGRLASLHFAPTTSSAKNLKDEGTPDETVTITGNTVIDALHYTANKLNLNENVSEEKKTILVTLHRRENFGEPLNRICNALLTIAKRYPDIQIIWPVHPNPNVGTTARKILGEVPNVSLIDPLPYQELVQVMATCHLAVTDSGGIQEEAPALKKPVLVLREETERPELVELGGAHLVGSDEKRIVDLIETLLNDTAAYQKMVVGYSPYGDGKAAIVLVDKMLDYLSGLRVSSAA